jgi:glycosyltransferase involved in cell wall biosynthesis
MTFSWFASDHAALAVFFSRRFGKGSIVVVGGGDVARVPEIAYGTFAQSRLKQSLTRYALRRADRVLVVDPSLKRDAIANARVDGKNFDYVPTGYDPDYWTPPVESAKEPLVLTVSSIGWSSMRRKGHETFVRAAKSVSYAQFVLVGKIMDDSISHLKRLAPGNVTFTGFVPDRQLLTWYRKAAVYCQLSRYEGLPNALCEAMLCECVPVGTSYGGIPTAIGNTGFYVPFGDVDATAEAIAHALRRSELGAKARKRIQEKFPITRRSQQLRECFDSLVS